MYKKLLFIIALPLIMCACNKSTPAASNCVDTGIPTAAEIKVLQNYLTANSITATYDSIGFFYQVINPGTGDNPTISSTVTVQYTGKLLNGTVFDSNTSATGFSSPLSGLITGWQLGLPLIKKGGAINLYLPPSLAYGCNADGPIPGNSSLIFNITLLDVQ